VRQWALPGTIGLEASHRRAGERRRDRQRQLRSGQPRAHGQDRAQKIANIADEIPELKVNGPEEGDLLVIGWGGTYGSITTAVERCQHKGIPGAQAHLRYLNPMPRNRATLLQALQEGFWCPN